MEEAKVALRSVSSTERMMGALTIPLARASFQKVRELFLELQKKINEDFDDTEEADAIYQINFQIFPVVLGFLALVTSQAGASGVLPGDSGLSSSLPGDVSSLPTGPSLVTTPIPLRFLQDQGISVSPISCALDRESEPRMIISSPTDSLLELSPSLRTFGVDNIDSSAVVFDLNLFQLVSPWGLVSENSPHRVASILSEPVASFDAENLPSQERGYFQIANTLDLSKRYVLYGRVLSSASSISDFCVLVSFRSTSWGSGETPLNGGGEPGTFVGNPLQSEGGLVQSHGTPGAAGVSGGCGIVQLEGRAPLLWILIVSAMLAAGWGLRRRYAHGRSKLS